MEGIKMTVEPISYQSAVRMVMQNHYSKIMPKLTRRTLGLFTDEKLVGICTLGWGVRPEHTIRNIFPSVETKQYHEIGKLCVLDEMPRNTESEFLSKVIRWISQNEPEILVLYSWADGMLGKPGFVYQAANFYYGGSIWTRMYLNEDGQKVHRRTMQGLTNVKGDGKYHKISRDVTMALGYQLWYGQQLRYLFPVCSRSKWKQLQQESTVKWVRGGYPKVADLKWGKQIGKGVIEPSAMPPFVETTRIRKDKDQTELFAAEVSTATRRDTIPKSEVQSLDAAQLFT